VELAVSDAQWQIGPKVALILLYVAIGPSLIAYRCWGLGVATVGPAVASFFVNLTPVFAAILSAAMLGEAPQWFHAAAFSLIVLGIIVSARR
jgi:drug/metabolite transporter (DMT)-like permease